TIDGADEVERGTLNLIKGLGGALLREKIVASASRRLAIIVDGAKLVDRLGPVTPGAVEGVDFGMEVTLEADSGFSGEVRRGQRAVAGACRARLSPAGHLLFTEGATRIPDCSSGGAITAPPLLQERICRIVGGVESGLFFGRADPVFVADGQGVHRLDRPIQG